MATGEGSARNRPTNPPGRTRTWPRSAPFSPRLLALRQRRASSALCGSGTGKPEGRCAAGCGRGSGWWVGRAAAAAWSLGPGLGRSWSHRGGRALLSFRDVNGGASPCRSPWPFRPGAVQWGSPRGVSVGLQAWRRRAAGPTCSRQAGVGAWAALLRAEIKRWPLPFPAGLLSEAGVRGLLPRGKRHWCWMDMNAFGTCYWYQ